MLTFLQRWRQLCTRCHHKLLESERLDILLDNFVPDFGYQVQLQGPLTFDSMIKQVVRIEAFMIKKGELTLGKDNKQGSSNSNKDKGKLVNKNRDVVNDGVVNNVTTKPAKSIFNLSSSIQVVKAAENPTKENQQPSRFSRNKPWASRHNCEFTLLGEPLDVVYKTLM